jgi:hypothetical protein
VLFDVGVEIPLGGEWRILSVFLRLMKLEDRENQQK